MIYLNALDSIIEAVYLEDSLSSKLGECKVLVNPENIKYITNRTIILSGIGYEEDKIDELLKNGCKVISRVYYNNPGVEVCPYILRINEKLVWNGKSILEYPGQRELLNSGDCEYKDGVLYFPRLYDPSLVLCDKYGNLTSLGWALQQVGMNIKKDTEFINLDLIKTGKISL